MAIWRYTSFSITNGTFSPVLVKVGLPHCACSDKEDNIPGYAGVVRTSKPLDMVSAKLLMEQRGFVVFRKLGRDKFLTCAYLSRKPSQHLDVFDVSFSSVPAVLHNSSNCSADPALLETRAVRGGFRMLYGLSAWSPVHIKHPNAKWSH